MRKMTVKYLSVLILMVCVIIKTTECQSCDSDSVALVDGVSDSALTASSIYGRNEKYSPRYGKLRNTEGAGAWCPNTKGVEYIQVKFEKLQTLCSVQTQGRKEFNIWVTEFYVSTSKDCKSFAEVQEKNRRKIFAGNTDATSIRSNKLPSPVSARCVRIYPLSHQKFPCMRFGLRGMKESVGIHSCLDVRKRTRNSPSGEYTLTTQQGVEVRAYCEFGLGGGPYTFFHPSAYQYLTQSDINYIQKNKNNVLLRALFTDGTQPYGLAQQLQQFAHLPVQVLMNSFGVYKSPLNVQHMGSPYLYTGFIPRNQANKLTVQGLRINGSPIQFKNCDRNPNSYISFFANYREKVPVSYAQKWNWGGVCATILNKMRNPPSARLMPVDYYMFTEMHWGGCGCYGQTIRSGNTVNHKLLAMTVGLK